MPTLWKTPIYELLNENNDKIEINVTRSSVVSSVEGVDALPPELEAGVENVTAMGDDEGVFGLDHGTGKELLGTDISAAEVVDISACKHDPRQTRTAVVGTRDAQVLADITQTCVGAPVVSLDVIVPDPDFVDEARTDRARPVQSEVAGGRV